MRRRFLRVPTARLLIERRVMQGQVPAQACTEVLRQLKGIEIFPDCAHVRKPGASPSACLCTRSVTLFRMRGILTVDAPDRE